jgi:hypothetical protein
MIRKNDLRGVYPTQDAVHWALHHLVQTSPAIVAIATPELRLRDQKSAT